MIGDVDSLVSKLEAVRTGLLRTNDVCPNDDHRHQMRRTILDEFARLIRSVRNTYGHDLPG